MTKITKSKTPSTAAATKVHSTPVERQQTAEIAHDRTQIRELTGLLALEHTGKQSAEGKAKVPPLATGGDTEQRATPQAKRPAPTRTP